MFDSNSTMNLQKNNKVKNKVSVRKNIITVLTLFNIVSLSAALWLFLKYFSLLMGADVLSGTFAEKIYDPVVSVGFLFTPFTVLIVHIMGIVLLKRSGVLSVWWLLNYLPLIGVLFIIFLFFVPFMPIVLAMSAIVLFAPLFTLNGKKSQNQTNPRDRKI